MRVALDGNLGSRIQTYLHKLKTDGYNVIFETPCETLQTKYNTDKSRYALSYHLNALNTYIKAPSTNGHICIYERSPYTLKHIYADLDADLLVMDTDEHRVYQSLSETYGWHPDVIIYCYCDPAISHSRLGTNSKVSLMDITTLHIRHEYALDDHNCPIPIYKINDCEDEDTIYRCLLEILYKLHLNK